MSPSTMLCLGGSVAPLLLSRPSLADVMPADCAALLYRVTSGAWRTGLRGLGLESCGGALRPVQWAAARGLIINTGLLLSFPFPTYTRQQQQQQHINFSPPPHSSPVSLGGGGGEGIFSKARP